MNEHFKQQLEHIFLGIDDYPNIFRSGTSYVQQFKAFYFLGWLQGLGPNSCFLLNTTMAFPPFTIPPSCLFTTLFTGASMGRGALEWQKWHGLEAKKKILRWRPTFPKYGLGKNSRKKWIIRRGSLGRKGAS